MTDLAMSLSEQRAAHGLTLGELVRLLEPALPTLHGDAGVRAFGLHQDSRRVLPGDVFAARAGDKASGLAFVAEAEARGAVALLVERGGSSPSEAGLARLEVADARLAIALAAEAIYGFPTRALGLVGITGTNGKTTTAWLAEHALSAIGARPARLGTLGSSFLAESAEGALTTPEADDISRYAARIRERGATHLVMEVSSHALSLKRVEALTFDVAAFSNLTQDHLDFHGSMQDYREAKAGLFSRLSPRCSVINVDDPYGRDLARLAGGRVIRVGRDAEADIHPIEVEVDGSGIRGRIAAPRGEAEIDSRLVGEHNLSNLLLALGVLVGLGFHPRLAASGLSAAPQVPGRLERCDEAGDDVLVLVDYAHTPDALERVLAAARGLGAGELVCVFGCGGDRDPDKRPKMGAAVGRFADRAVITSDNPRSEAPELIARAIEPGLAGAGKPYELELDRARAIEQAVLGARAGDVVVIAGKGHETYQIVGDERRPFDDRREARRALAERRARARKS
jgi:UDP-N-acetylmuramoyl-L-alanyl-D-glutamate--2,6-diaminopimelate ligase